MSDFRATAKRPGIRVAAKGGPARAVGGGGKFEIIYGFLNSLEIGTVKVENVPGVHSEILRQPHSG